MEAVKYDVLQKHAVSSQNPLPHVLFSDFFDSSSRKKIINLAFWVYLPWVIDVYFVDQ